MKVLVVDIGGSNVKVWKPDGSEKQKLPSGKELGPQELLTALEPLLARWKFDAVSIGYPGEVRDGRPTAEPLTLAGGWLEFDFPGAWNCPVRVMNDASMQALGSYEGGRMLYFGLGSNVGGAWIHHDIVSPLALGALLLRADETFHACLSKESLRERGLERWRGDVEQATAHLRDIFKPDYVVLGGGNSDCVEELPPGCRRGSNKNAYVGGLRMWSDLRNGDPVPHRS